MPTKRSSKPRGGVSLRRIEATTLLDAVRIALAKEIEAGRTTVFTEELEAFFTRTGVPLPRRCNGEAHSNPHIDHCMVCLGSTVGWGWVGGSVRIK